MPHNENPEIRFLGGRISRRFSQATQLRFRVQRGAGRTSLFRKSRLERLGEIRNSRFTKKKKTQQQQQQQNRQQQQQQQIAVKQKQIKAQTNANTNTKIKPKTKTKTKVKTNEIYKTHTHTHKTSNNKQTQHIRKFKSKHKNHIFTFDYDKFTINPKEELPPIIDWIGLKWNVSFLHPETNKRLVNTASVFQARQPITSTSVGLWKNYRELLKPAEEVLAESGFFTL